IRENGATVIYSVGAFAEKQDRSIGDVLSRMPGIDVSQSGKIQYQGTDINKFYIEGSDLLGGKYGIATKGIDHEDVSQVEVLENHQSMQVLRGLSFSDQAAINLKLKSKSKAALLVHGDLGAGYSVQPRGLVVNANIFAMIVRGEYQNITTLKGNNIGTNISDELTDFTISVPEEILKPYIALSLPSTPNLQQKRSYFNRSWYISTNNLWKTRKGNDIKAQMDYSSTRLEGYSKSTTTYFLEGGNTMIVEDKSALSHSNELNGRFTYEANKKTYFLNNTMSASLGWNDMSLTTGGTLPNRQTTDTPDYSVTNNLKLIKRYGSNRLVTFYSINKWQSMPEKLTVNPDGGNNYGEKISQHSFYTDERVSIGFILNGTTLSLETGVT
ncbi:MAG: hypothetical protein K2H86_00070, partial [Muribaculaceae bacterium]|nr:hypothetical protein [Muribaculaceae bacterium]